MDYNKAIIVGRVCQSPELRTTPGGQSVATMGVATDRMWTDKAGAKQEAAEFHTIVLWGKLAETSSTYLQKGSLVLVEGRIETRTWTNKQGQQQRTTEIIAQEIQFGPKPTPAPAPQPKAPDPEKRSNASEQKPLLDGDDEDSGRSFAPAFGGAEDIGEPPF